MTNFNSHLFFFAGKSAVWLVKEAHGPTASDLVIETLDGRIPSHTDL